MLRVVCEKCGTVYKVNRREDRVFCSKCGTKLDYERESRERKEKEAFLDLSTLYTHPSDKAALDALKAIPGFTPLMKAFMSVWNEKQYRIINMSSNLRLSEDQMPKYYNMLFPICERLGIEVPELYLKLDVYPNAYTSGDTKPFIVLTTGLLETLPDELIPTVLAHECGHIACHHVLYSTMGKILLGSTLSFLGDLLTLPIQIAFAYWMRCSEFSADRAAVICDGTSEKMIETCFRFAGYDKDIMSEGSIDAFLRQAEEYKELVGEKWNKTLEFMLYNQIDHPLNAVRASDCKKWCEGEQYKNILSFINAKERGIATATEPFSIPMPQPSKYYIGGSVPETKEMFAALGFFDIDVQKIFDPKKAKQSDDKVVKIEIDGQEKFSVGTWFPSNAKVKLYYYEQV